MTNNEILALSAKLKPLTKKQVERAIAKTYKGYAVRYDRATCMDCGKRIKCGNNDHVVYCPTCGAKKRLFSSVYSKHCVCHHQKIEVVGGYQVVRTFAIRADYPRANEKPTFTYSEVVQNWIDEQGNEMIVARPTKPMSRYVDEFNWNGNMAIRRRLGWQGVRYSLVADSYTSIKLLDKVRRNGYNGTFCELPAEAYIRMILSDNDFEYLIKTGQNAMAKAYYLRSTSIVKKYKKALNICHRHGYIITDAKLWMDMVDMMTALGMDTHNPKHICPDDLKTMHDQVLQRKIKAQEKRDVAERRSEALEHENSYREAKKGYFGICFDDGSIFVSVIDSVLGMLEEGTAMHHCVYANDYWDKEKSLILSAKDKDGNRLETIEVNLETFNVVQSRGMFNRLTDSHDRIVSLVNENMSLIRDAV